MIVYLLTSPSGKSYVGQTTRDLDTRWHEHVYEACTRKKLDYPIHRALRKHAPEHWNVRVIWRCYSQAHMDLMEEHFIALLGDYNGNSGGVQPRHTPESRAKIAASAVGNTRRQGHTNSPEHREKQAAAARTYWSNRKGDARKRTRGTT